MRRRATRKRGAPRRSSPRDPKAPGRPPPLRDRARAAVENGAFTIRVADGKAILAAHDGTSLELADSPSRAEDEAIRRFLRPVLRAHLGQEASPEALQVTRDALVPQIEAARMEAREARRVAKAMEEEAERVAAADREIHDDAGPGLLVLEGYLVRRDVMPAIRAAANVGEDARLATAVRSYANAEGIEDAATAALALVEAAAGPKANDVLEFARSCFGLVLFVREPEKAEAPPAVRARYEETDEGIVHVKTDAGGEVRVLVCTFRARVVGEILRDDGVERVLHFEVEARVGERIASGVVPATRFGAMEWAVQLLGAAACVSAGATMRDRAREAIQIFSGTPPRRVEYLHSGWREIDGRIVYLHGAGAIGVDGPVAGVEVNLPAALQAFQLPAPPDGEALRAAVRASLALLDVAGDEVTVVGLGALYRAVLPGAAADVTIWFTGRTGRLKTSFAVVLLAHFGADFSPSNLPNWGWTANALESLLFAAKDALTVIDDAAPDGTAIDRQRQAGHVARVLRAQGNRSGRGRSSPDGSLRPARYPRGLALSTAEDVPAGESVVARALIVEFPPLRTPGAVDIERLTVAQREGAAGTYASAMSGFLRHLAGDAAGAAKRAREEFESIRAEGFGVKGHLRTPANLAHILVGWKAFLAFALSCGAVGPEEAAALRARVVAALSALAARQAEHAKAADPVARFLELLASALASGGAHLATTDGGDPTGGAGGLGWRRQTASAGVGPCSPQGRRVGWVDGADLFLDLNAALRAAQDAAGPVGHGVALSLYALGQRLRERGHLVSTESDKRNTIRRIVEGSARRVHHLRLAAIGYAGAGDTIARRSGSVPIAGRDGEAHGQPVDPDGVARCSRCGIEASDAHECAGEGPDAAVNGEVDA